MGRNTILNTILTFGAAFLGGIGAYGIASKAGKAKIFTPHMTKAVSTIVSTVMGTFKGLLKGFILGLGAGRIADAVSVVGKYINFDARFDKTFYGQAVDNKITQLENYIIKLIG